MKKRGELTLLFLFFIVIFLSNFPEAKATYAITVYGGNLYSGDSAQTKTGLNFSILGDQKNLIVSVMFRELNKTFVLRNSSCESAHNLTVCFKGTQFGYYNKTAPSELGTYSVVNTFTVSVFSYRAAITLDRQIIQREFLVLEPTNVLVSFKNTGDRTATNVYYYDYFPEKYFEITNITGDCKKNNGAVYWSGSLNINEELNCKYVLKALNPINSYLSKAVINYSDPEEPKTLESGEISLKVPEHPINITYSLENQKGENVSVSFIGNKLILKINFTNTARKTYYIRYFNLDYSRIERLPRGAAVYNDSKNYFYADSLLANETRQYTYPITTEFSGEYSTSLTAEYLENDIGKNVIVRIPLSVYLVPISAIFVNSSNASRLFIQNANRDNYSFVTSEIYLKTTDREFRTRDSTYELKSGWSKEILNYPENLAENFNLNLSLSYMTDFGEFVVSNYSFGSFEAAPAKQAEVVVQENLTVNETVVTAEETAVNETVNVTQETEAASEASERNITQVPQQKKEVKRITFEKKPFVFSPVNITIALLVLLLGFASLNIMVKNAKKKKVL